MLRATGICFQYGKKQILRDISIHVEKGDVVSLLGPNGSGKSTLIKALLGINGICEGEVFYEGRNIRGIPPKELARYVAYVPQIHNVAFPYRVIDVVLMGRVPHKSLFSKYTRSDIHIAVESLARLGISHLEDRIYTEISGGERQLTLIARALAQGAKFLIMDEPISGLDYGNQLRLLNMIASLASDGYTFIKSTHFPDHAMMVSSSAILLKDGAIIASGKPSDVISQAMLKDIYGVDVRIEICGDHRVCIPRLRDMRMNREDQC